MIESLLRIDQIGFFPQIQKKIFSIAKLPSKESKEENRKSQRPLVCAATTIQLSIRSHPDQHIENYYTGKEQELAALEISQG